MVLSAIFMTELQPCTGLQSWEGVEEWAEHTALQYTSVDSDSGEAAVASPNMLRPVSSYRGRCPELCFVLSRVL